MGAWKIVQGIGGGQKKAENAGWKIVTKSVGGWEIVEEIAESPKECFAIAPHGIMSGWYIKIKGMRRPFCI